MPKSRPILLSPEEVLALLDGQSYLTRPIEEPISPETNAVLWGYMERKYVPWNLPSTYLGGEKTGPSFICPYGFPEDKLWGKEWVWIDPHTKSLVAYDAEKTEEQRRVLKERGFFLQRSTHMKQDMSRLILTIKSVEAIKESSWIWKIILERDL